MRTGRSFIVPRVADLVPSPTLAVAKEAQALRRQGVDVIDFGPGEPDFVTPEHVRTAAKDALDRGFTHYAPSAGIPELRNAIVRKLQRENGLSYDPAAEVVVTPGAKQAILEAMLTVVQPGDEVLILEPGWGSYASIVQLAGGTPVTVQSNGDFSLDGHALRAAVTDRTVAIVVGSPGNPTGYMLRAEEWDVVRDVCIRHDLLLISDEIYERISYGVAPHISPATLPEMWERTITINGLSKAYAMTGWRLGYAAAPAPLMKQMLKVHEHSVTSAASFAQVGGVAALDGPQDPIRAMVDEFAQRRDIVVEGLGTLPGVACAPPDGAFYAFPDVSGTGLTGTQFAALVLRHGVALTPGIGFGSQWDTHVRLSFATSEENIRAGLDRMKRALAEKA